MTVSKGKRNQCRCCCNPFSGEGKARECKRVETLKWRRKAAIVGYIDVVISMLGVLGTGTCGVFIAIAEAKIKAAEKQPAEKLREPPTTLPPFTNTSGEYIPKSPLVGDFMVSSTLQWVVVGGAGALCFLHLVAAVKMLKATEYKYDPLQALCPTRFWVCLNVFVAVFSVPFYILLLGELGSAGYCAVLVYRLIIIYIIYQFFTELKQYINKINAGLRFGPIM